MKLLNTISILGIFLITILLSSSNVLSATYDFVLINDTTLNYTTGQDFVDVDIAFKREIKNKEYFFSTKGEQSFHIPDLLSEDSEVIKAEREYKKESVVVKNESGKNIPYTIEELELGQGMYVKVPNYKETLYTSPYKITVKYSTHDYVKNIYNWVLIEYPALHKDTKFEQVNEESKTRTQFIYNLSVVVDSSIPQLTKIYPTIYTSKAEGPKTIYTFNSDQRIGKPIYLEFGTNRIFKFEMTIKTLKTDSLIPEKYSSSIPALSTNIYELALPREFSENSQTVKIEKISPTPTKLTTNTEGNVIATFEVPANKNSEIYVSGYIWEEQKPYSEKFAIPNPVFKDYLESIHSDGKLLIYTLPTKYWEVQDSFIQSEASKLSKDKTYLMDIVTTDYTYIIEKLEYDQAKAADPNLQRIGAKAALQGGTSVCMEYSDSFIAILRAQGIPARAAFGYTSLDTSTQDRISHQWVQIWIPEYGWLSIDPSYESPNMAIGQNIQYVLWNTLHDDDFIDIKAYSVDNFEFDPSKYTVKIYAVDKESIPENLSSYSEIQPKNDTNDTKDTINLMIKTTPLGKALIIILPISIILFLLILLLSLIVLLIKRVKTRRALANQQP